ncbi:FIST signal transduction protein [Azonexus sp. IMCC34839]|uniref:FIST signal transduction protein n=1 Tax=Azonexus sp. IMCC34839 TaxID=3133695 RepID=UPI00399A170E
MFDRQQLFSGTHPELSALLREWQGGAPAMGLLAFLPEAEKARVGDLQAACQEAGIPLLGAIFPALISDAAFVTSGIWLLRVPQMPPHFLLEDMDAPPFDAGQRMGEAIKSALRHSGDHEAQHVLFMIFDGMLPAIGSALINLHTTFDRQLPCSGINAGSETFQPMPCLFDNTRLLGNAVIGMILPENTRFAVEHGYPVAKTIMRATSTLGNRIDKIDGRPAMTVYQEVIKAEFGIELTHQNFYDYAVHYPFGVVTALDVLVRIPVAFDEDGSIFCVGEVPPNSVLRLLRAPTLAESNCVDRLAVDLKAPGHQTPGGQNILTFYCAGRRMHFGEESAYELANLQAATGAHQLIGALTLGEIDSSHDLHIPRFHNASVVCLS